MRRRHRLAFLLSVASAMACSSNGDHVGQLEQPILNGTTDDTTEAVVMLFVQEKHVCSAFFITPTLLLTARHCVSTAAATARTVCDTVNGALLPLKDIKIVFGNSVTPGSRSFLNPFEILVPSEGTATCGNDIAILSVNQPFDLPYVDLRLDLPAVLGEKFKAIGYGYSTGVGSEGIRRSRGNLRVTHVGSLTLPSGEVASVEGDWIADKGPCGGDSGSPAIDVARRAFGVMSRGPSLVCEEMVYGSLVPVAEFIRRHAALRFEDVSRFFPDYVQPEWFTAPIPRSAKHAEDCRGAEQCEAPFSCLPVGDHFRCMEICEACPEGFVCDKSAEVPACVPALPVEPTAAALPEDAGTSVAPSAPDAAGKAANALPTSTSKACALAAPGATSSAGGAFLLLGALGALARRRQTRAANNR